MCGKFGLGTRLTTAHGLSDTIRIVLPHIKVSTDSTDSDGSMLPTTRPLKADWMKPFILLGGENKDLPHPRSINLTASRLARALSNQSTSYADEIGSSKNGMSTFLGVKLEQNQTSSGQRERVHRMKFLSYHSPASIFLLFLCCFGCGSSEASWPA